MRQLLKSGASLGGWTYLIFYVPFTFISSVFAYITSIKEVFAKQRFGRVTFIYVRQGSHKNYLPKVPVILSPSTLKVFYITEHTSTGYAFKEFLHLFITKRRKYISDISYEERIKNIVFKIFEVGKSAFKHNLFIKF